jgi:hypothetical protein
MQQREYSEVEKLRVLEGAEKYGVSARFFLKAKRQKLSNDFEMIASSIQSTMIQ